MTDASEPLEGTPLIAPSSVSHSLYEPVVDACRTVFDPEIPVNIYDLGLIYTVDITDENDVKIIMTQGRVKTDKSIKVEVLIPSKFFMVTYCVNSYARFEFCPSFWVYLSRNFKFRTFEGF